MFLLVSLCYIVVCGYGTLGEVTTASNGGPNLLNIISSTTTSASSISKTNTTVTSIPDNSTTEYTQPGQTDSDVHSTSPSVTTEHVDHTTPLGNISWSLDVESWNSSSPSTEVPSEHLQKDPMSTQTPDSSTLVHSSSSLEDTSRSTPTTDSNGVVSPIEATTPPRDQNNIETSSYTGRPENSSTEAASTPSTQTTSSSSTTTTATGYVSISDTTVSSEPSTNTPGNSHVEEVHKGQDPSSMNPFHMSIFGVCIGLAGALLIITLAAYIHVTLRKSRKKRMCINRDAKRTDWLKVRRFTINDVKASLGGIPENGDIWLEMNKDSSVVL